jgi:hypothetical protein
MDTHTQGAELVTDLEVLHQNGRAESIACLMSLKDDSQEFHQYYEKLERVSFGYKYNNFYIVFYAKQNATLKVTALIFSLHFVSRTITVKLIMVDI